VKEKISIPLDKHSWSPSPLIGQIVLVTTRNEDGGSNLAPKSWISMMAFEPPLLALGCNLSHWTAQNILRSHEFVVNIPGEELVDVIWRTNSLPHPRPVEAAGLTPVPAQKVKPPLIDECKAHLECVLEKHLVYGTEVIFIAEIAAVSIDKAALSASDPYQFLKMVVFLENAKYGVIENSHQIIFPPNAPA
jgi:flavin reductase (DIM6/NTAB) family NADH-FMN oxidoreductase RutF